MTNLLEMHDVTKTFHSGPLWQRETTVAVDRVSFAVSAEHPKITGVVGESGSGKTTLALMLLGHTLPNAGQIIYRGKDLVTMSKTERIQFRREVQPIFQDP